jgi:hypothetical protein
VSAAAAVVACTILLLLIPATRAAAQQFWRWLTVGRIEVVKVDFDSLPDEAKSLVLQPIVKPGPAQAVADAAEAARRAGFTPRLPRAGVLASPPRLYVLGPMSFGTVVRAADVDLALKKAGVTDVAVPQRWDGAQLTLQAGSSVTAEWNEITLMQGAPATLSTPSGFDIGAFAIAVLRAAGIDRDAAAQWGRTAVESPTLLLGVSADDKVTIREVRLNSGRATLIEDQGEPGEAGRITLLWSVPDRMYVLSGAITADFAIAVANSIN